MGFSICSLDFSDAAHQHKFSRSCMQLVDKAITQCYLLSVDFVIRLQSLNYLTPTSASVCTSQTWFTVRGRALTPCCKKNKTSTLLDACFQPHLRVPSQLVLSLVTRVCTSVVLIQFWNIGWTSLRITCIHSCG